MGGCVCDLSVVPVDAACCEGDVLLLCFATAATVGACWWCCCCAARAIRAAVAVDS